VIRVHFPNGKTDCRHCLFLKERSLRGACQCELTGEYIDSRDLSSMSPLCPVQFENKEE
jgi:hypothetical protein